jgi:integrase
VYNKHIAPALGNRRLCDINQLMIREVIKGLVQNGYQFETQNKVKILLVDMFDKAITDDFARKNPARGIKLVRDESEIKNTRVLTPEEQLEFFDCCKGTFYDNLFVVAVNTGLRPGEVCGLMWDDIDFDKMEISVERTLLYQKLEGDEQKTFHFDLPKTKQSKRKVPMNKACAIALKKQKLQSDVVKAKSCKFESVPDEFKQLLFTTKYGTPINAVVLGDAVNSIVDEINLMKDPLEEFERFSPHCFRHTFATRCFESGIQPKTVQSYLGHASLKMTMDLYTHVLNDKKQEEMNKLEDTMNRLTNVSEDELETLVNNRLKEIAKKNNNIIPLYNIV